MMNNTMMNNATVNATENNAVENKEVTMNAMEMYEKKWRRCRRNFLRKHSPKSAPRQRR